VTTLVVHHQPHRTLSDLDWISASLSHGSILSTLGASGKAGPIQGSILRELALLENYVRILDEDGRLSRSNRLEMASEVNWLVHITEPRMHYVGHWQLLANIGDPSFSILCPELTGPAVAGKGGDQLDAAVSWQ